jgi:hypothetical protein
MLEPVILDQSITDIAKLWRDETSLHQLGDGSWCLAASRLHVSKRRTTGATASLPELS